MKLRDEVELALQAWDAYEWDRHGRAVIDYDCRPAAAVTPVGSTGRVATMKALTRLAAEADGDLERQVRAHLTYLRALLGERLPLGDYVEATQGCRATGWSVEHVMGTGEVARSLLAELGVGWGPATEEDLDRVEAAVELRDVPDRLRELVDELEPAVRAATGTTASYQLSIHTVDVDEYWSYWLDGARDRARLRINLRNARFGEVRLREIVLHEVMGHALQAASWSAIDDPPWVRLLAVHAPQQVLLEGLAQALPLFVRPDDRSLVARARLGHYQQLVRSELHLMVNAGSPVADCVDHARRRVPFWSDEHIGDLLTDRATDPLLRSYLWSYPAGVDWFAALADHGDPTTRRRVLSAAYQAPLSPAELEALWPAGPPIGGNLAPC